MTDRLPIARKGFSKTNEQQTRRVIENRLGDTEDTLRRFLTSFGTLSLGETTLTLGDGTNNDVAPGYTAFARLGTGPTAAFEVSGFDEGEKGRFMLLANATGYACGLLHNNSGSAAENRINTATGGTVFVQDGGVVVLIYDSTSLVWRVLSIGETGSDMVSDGDYGDITVSGTGSIWTIDNDVVTYAKMQNVSATDKLLGRSTAGAGDVEEITCTSFARTVLDDADAGTARTTLGLAIGSDVQAYDAELAALAGLTSAADTLPYFTGSGTAALATFTAFARTILDDANEAAFKATVNLEIGTDVQAYSASLSDIDGNWTAASASGASSLVFDEDTDNGVNTATLQGPAALGANITVTLPAATTTVIGDDTTDTLSNKSVALGSNTVTGTMAEFDTAVTDGNFAYSGGAFHDGFSDYVANEHIDWTSTSSNFSTSGSVDGGAGTFTTLSLSGNATIYEAVNDGNPEIRLGSADAEELHVQAVYDSAAQTLDYVLFQTDAASATADKGLYRFNVDGADVLDIDDGGIDLDTGKALSIAGTDVLNATTLGSGVTGSSLTSVGTIATGVWEGTDVGVAHGGTGASDAGTARTNLGVAIGSDVQAYDAGLASIAGLTTAADRMIYTTALDTYAVATLTAAGRAILDDASAAAQRTTMGVAIGSDVQAWDAHLDDFAAITPAQGEIVYFNGTDWVALAVGTAGQVLQSGGAAANPSWTAAGSGDLLAANNLSDVANAGTSRTNLGVAIGSDVQAYDAGLASIAGLTTAADRMIYTTALDTYAVATLTAAGRAILDDADASAQRTTLGVAIGSDVQAHDAYLDDIAAMTAAQGNVMYFNGTDWVVLAPGTSGQFLKTQGAAANPVWDTIAGGGDLLASNNLSDVASATTSATNLGLGTGDSPTFTGLNLGGNITNYEAVNDGNPIFRMGSAAAESFYMQSVYDSAAQTLDYVLIRSDAASATANKGLFRINVDGTNILDIDDGGIDLDSGKALSIAGTDVLNATTLGSGVVSSSLTSVGTIATGTWQATDVGIAYGGTGASTASAAFDNLKQAASQSATGVVEKATDAEVRASTTDKFLSADLIESASAAVSLTDGASISLDWDSGINFTVTIEGDRTLSNPSNEQIGTWRRVEVTQGATGGPHTLSYGSEYVFPAGAAPVLSTGANDVDVLMIYCRSATVFEVYASFNLS